MKFLLFASILFSLNILAQSVGVTADPHPITLYRLGMPSPTGHSGEALTTNGSTLSWGKFHPYNKDLITFGINGSAFYQNRANHSGTQSYTTITGLGTLATQSATISDYLLSAVAAVTYSPIVGSTGLTTLGTITTGTWQGTVIAPAYLGSGSSITTKFLRGDGTWQTLDLSGYQPLDSQLTSIAGLANAVGVLNNTAGGVMSWGGVPVKKGAGTFNSGTIAVGLNALINETIGEANTAIGYQAMRFATSGSMNTAVGHLAIYTLETGDNNVAVGMQAMELGTGGEQNTAIGTLALNKGGASSYNTIIGYNAGSQITDGESNVSIGYGSLLSLTSGDYNVAIGEIALANNITGSGNVAIGWTAGANETGSNSFFVNNQSRGDLTGDRALSLLYGTFAAAATDQQLTVNAGTLKVHGGTTGGKIVLQETDANGISVTGFIAPASLAGDVIYTLPSADGVAGRPLSTNGSATLTWNANIKATSTGVQIEATTAPEGNPPVGAFILYVDPADNTLRARGSSGTITILAIP